MITVQYWDIFMALLAFAFAGAIGGFIAGFLAGKEKK